MENVLLPEESSPQQKKLGYLVGGVVAIYFLVVLIYEFIEGAKAYQSGHLFIAFSIIGVFTSAGLLIYWFVHDTVESSVARLAGLQLFSLFILSIGIFVLATTKSPMQECLAKDATNIWVPPSTCVSALNCWGLPDSCVRFSGSSAYCGHILNGTNTCV